MRCSHSPSPTGTNGTDVRRSLPWARTIRLQQLYQLPSLLCVFSTLGNLLFSKLTNPNRMETSDSGTLLSQGTRLRGADASEAGALRCGFWHSGTMNQIDS